MKKVLYKVIFAISEIDREVDFYNQTLGHGVYVGQLKDIRCCLLKIKDSLSNHAINKHYAGFGKVIVDNWPLYSNLGVLLLDVEQDYKKLIN